MQNHPRRLHLATKLGARFHAIRSQLIVSAALIALPSFVTAQSLLYIVDSVGDGGNLGSVTQCDDGTGHCTLRAAIEAANFNSSSDGIRFNLPAGSVINLTRALPAISNPLNVNGPGPDRVTVRRNAGGAYAVFTVRSTAVTLAGMSITNGDVSGRGGGIDAAGSGVTVSNCSIFGNHAGIEGAGIYADGFLSIRDCSIFSNVAGAGGGGVHFFSGGGNGNFLIKHTTISSNEASSQGGSGGGIENNGGILTVSNSAILGNTAGSGGGIFTGGTVTITNSTIANNSATIFGGGIDSGATLHLETVRSPATMLATEAAASTSHPVLPLLRRSKVASSP